MPLVHKAGQSGKANVLNREVLLLKLGLGFDPRSAVATRTEIFRPLQSLVSWMNFRIV